MKTKTYNLSQRINNIASGYDTDPWCKDENYLFIWRSAPRTDLIQLTQGMAVNDYKDDEN